MLDLDFSPLDSNTTMLRHCTFIAMYDFPKTTISQIIIDFRYEFATHRGKHVRQPVIQGNGDLQMMTIKF